MHWLVQRTIRLLFKAALLLAVGGCFLFVLFWWGCTGPSDATLIRNFRHHQADLQTLVSMSDKDPRLIRIAFDFTRLDDNWAWPRAQSDWGFSPERWNEYRGLFSAAGIKDGLYRSALSNEIFLLAWSQGIVNRGEYRGYVYRGESKPDDRDAYPPCKEGKVSFDGDKYRYKRIAEHWYIWDD